MFCIKYKHGQNEVYDTVLAISVYAGEEVVLYCHKGVYNISPVGAKEISNHDVIFDYLHVIDSPENNSCAKIVSDEIANIIGEKNDAN